MPTYEGCVEAKEISLTRKGANQFAKVLIRKTAAEPAAPGNQVETSDMPTQAEITKAALAITKSMAVMDEVTKTYFLALGDDVGVAFLEKSAADQKTEAHAAKALVDAAAVEAEIVKSGKSAREVELEKSVGDLRSEIETLKAGRVDDAIEKRAVGEFKGYPGGVAAAVEMLKTAAKLDETGRKNVEDLMRAQAANALASTVTLAGRSEEDVSKAAGAREKIMVKAREVAKAKGITEGAAFIECTELPEFEAEAALLV